MAKGAGGTHTATKSTTAASRNVMGGGSLTSQVTAQTVSSKASPTVLKTLTGRTLQEGSVFDQQGSAMYRFTEKALNSPSVSDDGYKYYNYGQVAISGAKMVGVSIVQNHSDTTPLSGYKAYIGGKELNASSIKDAKTKIVEYINGRRTFRIKE